MRYLSYLFSNMGKVERFSFRELTKKTCQANKEHNILGFRDCSETKWQKEIHSISRMFILLNEFHVDHTAPYFFSALLEIGYKVLKFGNESSPIQSSE